MRWAKGDLLRHRHSPELGPGRVRAVDGRTIAVDFPKSRTHLRMAADSEALVRVELLAGDAVEIEASGELTRVAEVLGDGRLRTADGQLLPRDALLPARPPRTAVDDLAAGEVSTASDWLLRRDAIRLLEMQETSGLATYLGGKVHLFPHQLHAALRATASDPVRWLLADEVGLGKTVEACLVADHLIRTGRAERTLIAAPDTLTVQWLGELWRKYHQVFVLLDDKRLADVKRDFGKGFNPFDTHRRAIAGFGTLLAHPELTEQAVAAGIDLLVVDEAHHLRRPPGHPGSPIYRAVAPIAALRRHVLLLSAVPLEDDAHGFFRLLQLLRPEALPEDEGFEERLARREPLPPCTSSARRADIGGLPPRVPRPVEIDDPVGWQALADLEAAVRAVPARNPVERKAKVRRLAAALSSGAALLPLLAERDAKLRELAQRAVAHDPRTSWIVDEAPAWRARGEKTLVFVAERSALEALQAALRREHLHVGAFHEDMSPAQRDIEVAQFRLESGADILISTESGGEGRNFQFCHRLVLYDLPWGPAAVEQRIGRLDRIGRKTPVEIVYFRSPGGLALAIAHLHEQIGIFREPLGGLLRELHHIEEAVEEAALATPDVLEATVLPALVTEARTALTRVQEAAYHELHREPFTPELGPAILARIPAGIEELTEHVVRGAAERLGLTIERQRGAHVFAIELGRTSVVDSLPGVPGGASFLGSFSREESVEVEALDFYGASHPIVQGLLADLLDHGRYRAAYGELEGGPPGFGLVAGWLRGAGLELVAIDASGRERPDWIELLEASPGALRQAPLLSAPGWSDLVTDLAARLPREEPPDMVLAIRLGGPKAAPRRRA